jgi:hypothetical protein
MNNRLVSETKQFEARIKENQERIKLTTRLPYLVATVGELIAPFEEEEESGSGMTKNDNKNKKKEEAKTATKAAIIKTSQR